MEAVEEYVNDAKNLMESFMESIEERLVKLESRHKEKARLDALDDKLMKFSNTSDSQISALQSTIANQTWALEDIWVMADRPHSDPKL